MSQGGEEAGNVKLAGEMTWPSLSYGRGRGSASLTQKFIELSLQLILKMLEAIKRLYKFRK